MKIEFLGMKDGYYPVFEFFEELNDPKLKKKLLRDFELIEKSDFGMLLRSEILKKMKGYEQYNLYEYKLRFNKTQYRVLCHINNSLCHMVHAFIKKEQKTRSKHIETAISRITTYLSPL